jgi:uncharacterized Tic20 family protein
MNTITPSAPIPPTATDGANPSSEERNLAMVSHIGTLIGFIIPFGGIAVPLIIWLIKKVQSAYITEHAKESLNFQISILTYFIVSMVLMVVLIGFVLAFAVGIFALVCVIQASIKASEGKQYRYPLTFRLVS